MIEILGSAEMLAEFSDVIVRPKFSRQLARRDVADNHA
jgi:hypothetical protein